MDHIAQSTVTREICWGITSVEYTLFYFRPALDTTLDVRDALRTSERWCGNAVQICFEYELTATGRLVVTERGIPDCRQFRTHGVANVYHHLHGLHYI